MTPPSCQVRPRRDAGLHRYQRTAAWIRRGTRPDPAPHRALPAPGRRPARLNKSRSGCPGQPAHRGRHHPTPERSAGVVRVRGAGGGDQRGQAADVPAGGHRTRRPPPRAATPCWKRPRSTDQRAWPPVTVRMLQSLTSCSGVWARMSRPAQQRDIAAVPQPVAPQGVAAAAKVQRIGCREPPPYRSSTPGPARTRSAAAAISIEPVPVRTRRPSPSSTLPRSGDSMSRAPGLHRQNGVRVRTADQPVTPASGRSAA